MAPRRKTKTRYRNHLWVSDRTPHGTFKEPRLLALLIEELCHVRCDRVCYQFQMKSISVREWKKPVCFLLISISADGLPHYLTLLELLELLVLPQIPSVWTPQLADYILSYFFCVVWGVVIRSKDSCQCSHRDVMFRPLEVWAHVEACHDPCTHKRTHRVCIQRKPHFHTTVATFAANHKMEAIRTSR